MTEYIELGVSVKHYTGKAYLVDLDGSVRKKDYYD